MAQATAPRLIDSAGNPVPIAPKPFAIGGEGAVYEVQGDPGSVAKVYKAPQPPDRSEKLRTMATLATPGLLKIAAWPTRTLHTKPGGPVTGILMPRVSGFREIHHLYSVAQRKKDFPSADWKFLTYAAMNSAIAFEEIHRNGHVVGDVNQKNVLVSPQAIVQFVDCDSFQVRGPGGRVYRCVVGVPEYTPPELQGVSFRTVDRTPDHDLFGLAVLVFHLLMMGRHPFSGVYLDPGDMPLEKAIQDGRFAYARDPMKTRMKPPPHTVPLSVLDGTLVGLFERAFQGHGRSGPTRRPTATEWRDALASFLQQMTTCKIDPRHAYPRRAGRCPWCDLLGSGNLVFFLPGVPGKGAAQAFDLLAVWGRVERIPAPDTTYARPAPPPQASRPIPANLPPPTPEPELLPVPTAPSKPDPFLTWVAAAGCLLGLIIFLAIPIIGVACMVGFAAWLVYQIATYNRREQSLLRAYREEKDSAQELNRRWLSEWEGENPAWCREYRDRVARRDGLAREVARAESVFLDACNRVAMEFTSSRKSLASQKSNYEVTQKDYGLAIADLGKRSAQIQLDSYLDSQLIRDARIKSLSNKGIASLGSFGIETALDVLKLGQVKVPGIGPVLTQRLEDWRNALIRSFTPKPGIPAQERTKVDQKYLPKLRNLESLLIDGASKLQGLADDHKARRKAAMHQIGELVARLGRAEKDVEVMDELLAQG